MYSAELYPFRFRRLPSGNYVAISESGDYVFLDETHLRRLIYEHQSFQPEQLAEFHSKFFIGSTGASGSLKLLASRIATKRETVLSGPSLHAIVTTLQCAHSCQYCQVSRVLDGDHHSMTLDALNATCATIFDSPARTLTVEFQGGDPLIRFDLIKHAVERISERNEMAKRGLRFVVASTLHQLTEDMCEFFRKHMVFLSTSVDGPSWLHNKNRPIPTRDAYERTVAGINMARELIGPESISALMTTSLDSLEHPEAIVDEYAFLGFTEIFLRHMSEYGFAKRNLRRLGYSLDQFSSFYERAFDHVLELNRAGTEVKEITASIALNKILSTFDGGYVDLQSPTGAGLGALIYNYDGFVYPSDEARMLAEMGDPSLRLGQIGTPLHTLLGSTVERDLVRASLNRFTPGCDHCAYRGYCGPDPINAKASSGSMFASVLMTSHCQRNQWLFDFMFERLKRGDSWFLDLAYRWSAPTGVRRVGNA